jgi:alanyl-tRNA synthetase
LANENKEKLFIGIGISEKMQYIVVTQSKNFKANEIIKQINTITNGVGGGKENTAQGGSSDKNKMEDLLSFVSGL